MAAPEAAKTAIWIENLINDLQLPSYHFDRIPLSVDHRSAPKFAKI